MKGLGTSPPGPGGPLHRVRKYPTSLRRFSKSWPDLVPHRLELRLTLDPSHTEHRTCWPRECTCREQHVQFDQWFQRFQRRDGTMEFHGYVRISEYYNNTSKRVNCGVFMEHARRTRVNGRHGFRIYSITFDNHAGWYNRVHTRILNLARRRSFPLCWCIVFVLVFKIWWNCSWYRT